MANGKSIKLTNGSIGDGNRYNQSMNGSNHQNIQTIRQDDRPIDLIDDNSDDLFNDSYMDIDNDPGNCSGGGGSIYSPMTMSNLPQSHWDDGILMGPDSGNGTTGNVGVNNIPTTQRQQLMAKLMHQDFFNKFDDLLDNDDLE
ncbi:hypothetical protein BLA29_010335 [Euroglyphus maynei]|uniref:Uncharacterized protein n=1 Tax=Euroglyphus maynei TaxID=6958 RepID=A0A1Y3BQB3_EURMA|nr:hypothetical protein BLA29_010335 [Euroglyphus maynei]